MYYTYTFWRATTKRKKKKGKSEKGTCICLEIVQRPVKLARKPWHECVRVQNLSSSFPALQSFYMKLNTQNTNLLCPPPFPLHFLF